MYGRGLNDWFSTFNAQSIEKSLGEVQVTNSRHVKAKNDTGEKKKLNELKRLKKKLKKIYESVYQIAPPPPPSPSFIAHLPFLS